MFGTGLLKGLGVTFKRFADTYIDDVKHIPSRYAYGHDAMRQMPDEKGIFTIQYPEEKRELPERFRYIPMLIYDTPKQEDRCTACGICAKVCPPQCIWIVRDSDESGKPIPRPGEFYIDASICMSCGFCAEFCPFDAIKMDQDYELSSFERFNSLVFGKARLTKPDTYHAAIHPTDW
ncbi:MAG TPA: 4Fe-4S binding protein, partial [Anaerolineae bacterium]|nr:4Fe-4S binding protein [Anaerolineae bacterium]